MNEGKKPVLTKTQEWDKGKERAENKKKIDAFLIELSEKIKVLNILKQKKDGALADLSDSENRNEQIAYHQIQGYTDAEVDRLISQKESEIGGIKKQLAELSDLV